MSSNESNSFFDQRIMPVLSHFDEPDRIRLCKFLFNAFSDTAAKYFRTYNLPESEVRKMVNKEHSNFEAMLLEHLKSITTSVDEPNVEVENIHSQTSAPTDDQFISDAIIDMELLFKEIEGN